MPETSRRDVLKSSAGIPVVMSSGFSKALEKEAEVPDKLKKDISPEREEKMVAEFKNPEHVRREIKRLGVDILQELYTKDYISQADANEITLERFQKGCNGEKLGEDGYRVSVVEGPEEHDYDYTLTIQTRIESKSGKIKLTVNPYRNYAIAEVAEKTENNSDEFYFLYDDNQTDGVQYEENCGFQYCTGVCEFDCKCVLWKFCRGTYFLNHFCVLNNDVKGPVCDNEVCSWCRMDCQHGCAEGDGNICDNC
jgi:hypothetical protein